MSCDNSKVKVLLVDDESDITTVLQIGLQKQNFDVDAFNDPQKALTEYKPNYYDAIVLDVKMQGITGFELAKELWVKDENAKICFLSAFEIHESEAKKVFTNFKNHCFIKKPILPSDLAKHIKEHMMTRNQGRTMSK